MLVIQNTIAEIVNMSAEEARSGFDQIKENIESSRNILLKIQQRQGWKELGYKSWREAVASEFGSSQSKAYRELAAALVEESLGEEAATFGKISASEGELLKRLEDRGQAAIIQALTRSEDIAYSKRRNTRTLSDLHQAVDEILRPNWVETQLFSVKIEDCVINVRFSVEYKELTKQIKFIFTGGLDTISSDGSFEDIPESKYLRKYDFPEAYAAFRASQLYNQWQVAVNLKAKLNRENPLGSFVKLTRDIPDGKGDVGKIAIVIDATYDGLCVKAEDWDTGIVIPRGYFQALRTNEQGKVISSLEDVDSVQDMDALIDMIGVKMLSFAFTHADDELQVKIAYFYPGIGALVASELGGTEYNKTIKATGQVPNIEPDTVIRQVLETENLKLETSLLETEQLLQRREQEVNAFKSEANNKQILENELMRLKADIQQLQQERSLKEKQYSKRELEAAARVALAEMNWTHTAYIKAGEKLLETFIAKLNPQ